MLWGIELRKPFKLEPFPSGILFPLPTSSLSPTREALFTAGDPSSSNVLFDEVVLPRAVTGSSDSGMGLAPNMTGLPVDRNMRKVWMRNLAREENVVIYSTGNLIRIRHQNGTSVTFNVSPLLRNLLPSLPPWVTSKNGPTMERNTICHAMEQGWEWDCRT